MTRDAADLESPAPPWWRWWTALTSQTLFIVAVVAFAPSLEGEFLSWDDQAVIVDNPNFRGLGPSQLRWMFTTYHAGHYQPITWLSYALDHLVWGMDPTGYHLTNVLLHAVNGVLVYLIARVLLHRVTRRSRGAWWAAELGAATAALLFVVHPLRVESVAWVTERRDLVSGLFVLLTVLTWLRATRPIRRRSLWLVASVALYLLSMLSKIGGAPLPVVLLVLDWHPLGRLRFGRRSEGEPLRALLEKIPFFGIALGFSLATIVVQSDSWSVPLDRHGLAARFAQAAHGLVFYVQKSLWPVDLLPLYELHLPLDPLEPRFVIAGVLVVAWLVTTLVLARRLPALLAATLCYAALIGPLLGFFQNGPQLVADRYSYLSCIAWGVLVGGGIAVVGRRGRGVRLVLLALTVVVAVALTAATWRQCRVWRSTEAFWSYMIEHDPGSSFAHNGWGWVMLSRGRTIEALTHFERALQIDDWNRNAWFNRWAALRTLGRDEALVETARAGTSAPLLTVRAAAHAELARLAADRGAIGEAIAEYESAVAIHPDLVDERLELARLLLREGRDDEGRSQLREILQRVPDHPVARRILGDS